MLLYTFVIKMAGTCRKFRYWQQQGGTRATASVEVFYVRDTYLRWLEANPVYITLVQTYGSAEQVHQRLGISSLIEQTAAAAHEHHDIGAKDHNLSSIGSNDQGDITARITRLQTELGELARLVKSQ